MIAVAAESSEKTVLPTYVYPDARVLLAEDMVLNQKFFKELIAPWQMQVDVAEDGAQAVEAALNYNYQMIFLDNLMPGMDGLTAAAKIREHRKYPMVLLTADMTEELQKNYTEYGFDACMQKPVLLHELKQVIETHIHPGYRRMPQADSVTKEDASDMQMNVSTEKEILEVYCQELAGMIVQLSGLVHSDLDLFRTKVHGIKSASKQLGFIDIGEQAEILEMAAKVDNLSYIDRHLQSFIDACNRLIRVISR